MSLAQENFERATQSAQVTLRTINKANQPVLAKESIPRLRTWLWDLEAIGAALRLELMNREEKGPVDLG